MNVRRRERAAKVAENAAKTQRKHACMLAGVLAFFESVGEWPTVPQYAEIVGRPARTLHERFRMLEKRGFLTKELLRAKNGRRSDPLMKWIVTEAGREEAKGADPNGYSRFSYGSSVRAQTGYYERRREGAVDFGSKRRGEPGAVGNVHADVLAAVREWFDIVGEWPTRDEVVQMVEDYDANVTISALRDLTIREEIVPLLYVTENGNETRMKHARVPQAAA